MKVLLSIKPDFVQEIATGKKKFEYRKRIFKQDVDSVIIYASRPVGMIVGEFKVDHIIMKSPRELWEETEKYSGITEEFFSAYFDGRDEAYAIKIKDLCMYDEPINPYKVFDDFVAPQSYKYVDESHQKLLYA